MSSLGVVIYGSTPTKRQRIAAMAKKLGFANLHVLNNHSASLQLDEISGSNQHYEFSGYRELCRHFTGEGPFVILNDTLWVNRWVGGWRSLLRSALKHTKSNAVWGDVRIEGGEIPERPNTYLASWVFVIPNREVLNQFADSLDDVMHDSYPPPSPAYQGYLDRWFAPRWYGGWHGVRSEEALARKRHCIRMEHALSALLSEKNLPLCSLGENRSLFYSFVRLVDRSLTFLRRLKAIQT
jgi:hypothetical protein